MVEFPLISSRLQSYDYVFHLYTEVNGHDLLSRKKSKVYLADGFDHLPISLKLKS